MILLRDREKILLIKRRHWLVLVLEILPIAFGFVVVIILMIAPLFVPSDLWFHFFSVTPFFSIVAFNFKFFFLFFGSLLLSLFWQILFILIAYYYLDYWIVTDERTIHTELRGLFNRLLATIYHHRIQDISVEVKGILATFFQYGDIQIQTAGSFKAFVIQQIPQPYQTKDLILEAQMEFLQKIKEKNILVEELEKET